MLTYCQLDPWEHTSITFEWKYLFSDYENAFEIDAYKIVLILFYVYACQQYIVYVIYCREAL